MTQSCLPDVVAAVQRVMDVNRRCKHGRWLAVPYDVVASILRYEYGHTEAEAHALIFEAVVAGLVTLDMARLESIDSKEQLCLERKDQDA